MSDAGCGPIRALVVSPVGDLSGSSSSLLETTAKIGSAELQTHWLLPDAGPLTAALAEAGISYEVVKGLRLPSSDRQKLTRLGTVAKSLPGASWQVARIAKRQRCDLVHSNSAAIVAGAYGSRLSRLPHIWHIREIVPAGDRLGDLLRREIDARSEAIVCVSEAAAEGIRQGRVGGVSKLQVLHSGLDWSRLPETDRSPARAMLGIPDEALVVGSAGYLNPRKGMDLLLEAFAICHHRSDRQLHLVLAGDPFPGNEWFAERLHLRAAKLGVAEAVSMPGYLKQITALLAAIDIFALVPTEPEGLGRSLIEAMAYGVPSIGSAAGGILEIIDQGSSGILVEPRSVGSITAALEKLIGDPELRDALSVAGRRSIETRFDLDHNAQQLLDIYRKLGRGNA